MTHDFGEGPHGDLSRRTFLAGTGTLGLGALGTRRIQASEAPRPGAPESWKKGPVLLGGDGTPEGRGVQNFTCVAEPLDSRRWRLWFSSANGRSTANIGVAEGVPGEALNRTFAKLSPGEPEDAPLSIGNLPADWRPVQPVYLRLKDGRHRIYFWAHGPGVNRYLAAESDDGRRFRVLDPLRPVLYHPSDRAVGPDAAREAGLPGFARTKPPRPDGEPAARAGLISNDAADVYRNPQGGFELYSVGLIQVPKDDPRYIGYDNAPGFVRVIDRRTSDDGLNWSDRRRVLVPDAADPPDQQFYYLSVTRTDRGLVGMLGHYRVRAQTMDLEWCYSKDGLTWERPYRRPWIPRGRPGHEPDSYGIYAPHSLVPHDGRWWLFYTGVNDAHNGKDAHGKPGAVVQVATTASIWA